MSSNSCRKDLLEVISPGTLTTVQDLGRFGYRRYGVPVSGAMDSFALRAANILAGNDANRACLEMTISGVTVRAMNPCTIAVTGADMHPALNGQRIETWFAHGLKREDILSLSHADHGCRTYLAVAGGIHVPLVLGSRSTYLKGGFGGNEGRPIRKGDILRGELSDLAVRVRYVPQEHIPHYDESPKIRVVMGPQDDFFAENGLRTFLSSTYEVTSESDRMGYRLRGPVIEHSGEPEIVSDGIAVGAIQVPGDGMPIVLMRDTQTTGGYPKIAHVVSPDLDSLSQLRPGDTVRFERTSVDEAHELLFQYAKSLDVLKQAIREHDLIHEYREDENLMRFQGAIR